MPRIIIVKQVCVERNEYDDVYNVVNACTNNDWQTVSVEEYKEIVKLVNQYNDLKFQNNHDHDLVILEERPICLAKVEEFADVRDFLEKRRIKAAEAEAARVAKAEARKKTDLEKVAAQLARKQKEFEKLKKELGK